MIHKMHLKKVPFDKIKQGKKTIELRLYDEKRQKISSGDVIQFDCDGEKISVSVKKLHLFSSFQKLYEALPLEKCGYSQDDLQNASYTDMEEYYPLAEQQKVGVVGIEFTLMI